MKMAECAALQLFPEEVWELIVDKLEDPEVIKTFLKAFPELKDILNGQHFSWLIGDLMPLIMSKYLTEDDILSCRLVSKRWRNSVGTTLETHPDRHPYKSTRLTQMSERHMNYSLEPCITTNLGDFLESGCTNLPGAPVTENPFPGRHVSAKVVIPYSKMEHFTNLAEALPVLKVFGHHVWYFSVDYFMDKRDLPTEESFIHTGLMPLLDCLSCLPNLRSLRVTAWGLFKKTQTVRCKLTCDNPLAKLPFQLETLDMRELYTFPEDIYASLLHTFGRLEGIQKLGVGVKDWKQSYGALFPNLKEINIGTYHDFVGVFDVLNGLPSPGLLRKLKISSAAMNICNFLKELANFPCQLESLQIDVGKLYDDPEDWSEDTVFPTIHALKVNAGYELSILHFRFLKAFPELKYFTLVHLIWTQLGFDFFRGRDMENPIHVAFSRYVFENKRGPSNFAALWEQLSKLQMLTIIDLEAKLTYQYACECQGQVFKSRAALYD